MTLATTYFAIRPHRSKRGDSVARDDRRYLASPGARHRRRRRGSNDGIVGSIDRSRSPSITRGDYSDRGMIAGGARQRDDRDSASRPPAGAATELTLPVLKRRHKMTESH
jgi:hypothetical protein